MKRTFKKILSLVLVVMTLFSMFSMFTVNAQAASILPKKYTIVGQRDFDRLECWLKPIR